MNELLNYILNHEQQFRRATRLASLYSDFRVQQTTNPDGYAANISAWQLALAHATRKGLIPSDGAAGSDLLTLRTGEELLRALETKEWGRPLALGAVVRGLQNDAVSRKTLVPLSEFLGATKSVYAKSWTVTPWQVAIWGLKQLGLAGGASGEDRLSLGRFVVLGNVEEAAKGVLRKIEGRTSRADRILPKDMFERDFGGVLDGRHELTESDHEVLLTFLSRDKQAISYNGQTIKFKAPSESLPSHITEQDITIASLKTLISSLTLQTSTLTSRINDLSTSVRTALAAKNRDSAMTSLRSQKLAVAALRSRSQTLAQLEEVYNKIEQAADQVEIVRVMQGSTGVLKSLNKEVGGVERVEDVVEGLREEMTNVDEVGNVISEGGIGAGEVDDAEVEDELEAMEKEEKELREKLEAQDLAKRFAEFEAVKGGEREGRDRAKADKSKKGFQSIARESGGFNKAEKEESEKAEAKDAPKTLDWIRSQLEKVGKSPYDTRNNHELPSVDAGETLQSGQKDDGMEVEESIQGLDRMSLDEERPTRQEDKASEKHRNAPEALPAA